MCFDKSASIKQLGQWKEQNHLGHLQRFPCAPTVYLPSPQPSPGSRWALLCSALVGFSGQLAGWFLSLKISLHFLQFYINGTSPLTLFHAVSSILYTSFETHWFCGLGRFFPLTLLRNRHCCLAITRRSTPRSMDILGFCSLGPWPPELWCSSFLCGYLFRCFHGKPQK